MIKQQIYNRTVISSKYCFEIRFHFPHIVRSCRFDLILPAQEILTFQRMVAIACYEPQLIHLLLILLQTGMKTLLQKAHQNIHWCTKLEQAAAGRRETSAFQQTYTTPVQCTKMKWIANSNYFKIISISFCLLTASRPDVEPTFSMFVT